MKYKIGDLCTYMGSGGTPSRKNKEYYQNGHIKWLKTKELNGLNNRYFENVPILHQKN